MSADSLPFDNYPEGGRQLLGRRKGNNCRKGYGLGLQRITGQTTCGYCGLNLVGTYEHWLHLEVDHVVPWGAGRVLGVPDTWLDDLSNLVLACSACNRFNNREKTPAEMECPATLDEFFNLRDDLFRQRKARILAAHI